MILFYGLVLCIYCLTLRCCFVGFVFLFAVCLFIWLWCSYMVVIWFCFSVVCLCWIVSFDGLISLLLMFIWLCLFIIVLLVYIFLFSLLFCVWCLGLLLVGWLLFDCCFCFDLGRFVSLLIVCYFLVICLFMLAVYWFGVDCYLVSFATCWLVWFLRYLFGLSVWCV